MEAGFAPSPKLASGAPELQKRGQDPAVLRDSHVSVAADHH